MKTVVSIETKHSGSRFSIIVRLSDESAFCVDLVNIDPTPNVVIHALAQVQAELEKRK